MEHRARAAASACIGIDIEPVSARRWHIGWILYCSDERTAATPRPRTALRRPLDCGAEFQRESVDTRDAVPVRDTHWTECSDSGDHCNFWRIDLHCHVAGDAAGFLHNQLSNDIQHLDDAHVRRAGLCSPKGRLLASFLVWKSAEAVQLM